MKEVRGNLDEAVVSGFGDEWSRFDQRAVPEAELRRAFSEYFAVFPWHLVPADGVGFDAGCGTGRWARLVAERLGGGVLHCIDASAEALAVARRNLKDVGNCVFHHASVDAIPLPDSSCDFGYSLGVLHHMPDTSAGLRACVAKLKPGAPFQVYLYYRFDNRPWWYRRVWEVSDAIRRRTSRLPHSRRYAVSQLLAVTVYWPLARMARLLEAVGLDASRVPLHYYSKRSFYTMRTDALDRFGTRLEQRFTKSEIEKMMRDAGLTAIKFSDQTPFWCASGIRTEAAPAIPTEPGRSAVGP